MTCCGISTVEFPDYSDNAGCHVHCHTFLAHEGAIDREGFELGNALGICCPRKFGFCFCARWVECFMSLPAARALLAHFLSFCVSSQQAGGPAFHLGVCRSGFSAVVCSATPVSTTVSLCNDSYKHPKSLARYNSSITKVVNSVLPLSVKFHWVTKGYC